MPDTMMKYPEITDSPTGMTQKEHYPSFWLDNTAEAYSIVDEFEVGDSFSAVVKLKIVSKSIDQTDSRKKASLTFDVLELYPTKGKNVEELSKSFGEE